MQENINKNLESKLILLDQKKLSLSGVTKVLEAKPEQIAANINKRDIFVSGKNLEIIKLDTVAGILEVDGEIYAIKFSHEKAAPSSFLKRIFK